MSESRYYNSVWLSGFGANENTALHAARADQGNSVIKFWPKLRRSSTAAIIRDGAKLDRYDLCNTSTVEHSLRSKRGGETSNRWMDARFLSHHVIRAVRFAGGTLSFFM
jgi:hypothetical protein